MGQSGGGQETQRSRAKQKEPSSLVDLTISKTLAPSTAPDTVAAHFIALAGVPLIKPGDDIATIILAALAASGEKLREGDVLILAQKVVSKAQGRSVPLGSVVPSQRAEQLARDVNKDPRLVELILRESTEVVRHRRDVLIVAHRLGFIIANAGIDFSNIEQGSADDTALLLPQNPDQTSAELRTALLERTGSDVAVIINDSHGRAFRNGTVGTAIGASGLPGLADLRGQGDLYGRRLQSSEVALADEIAAAASLLMGQADEGRPIVLARGIPMSHRNGNAAELVRERKTDLFRAQPISRSDIAEELLLRRRSVRRYTPEPVAAAVLEKLLHAAICAPSAHNSQPWRFAVMQTPRPKERLARAMGERLRTDRTRDGDRIDLIESDIARSFARVAGAPVVVIVCLTLEDTDPYPDERRRSAEHRMAVQGTAMAMQNLQLAACAAGLGASIMCAPLFCPDTVNEVCELPSRWEPQGLVTIGYPANAGKPFTRRALNEVVRYLDGEP
jgi:coenzyme F420-0:L-glutamate ligase / coenzyme F420-1:gamma-L-glutamate ligase